MNGGSGSPSRGRKSVHLSRASQGILNGRLHELLIMRNISARDLAERAGLPKTTVTDVLSGKTGDPSLGILIRFAHVFELRSIEELIAPLGTSELRRAEFGGDVVV